MKKEYYIIIGLSILLLVGYFYYTSQLNKQLVKPLEDKKEVLIIEQKKSLDSLKRIINQLEKDLKIEASKPPIIIPKYNEKIIYKSVNDTAIINSLSRERESYLQKQSR